MDLVVNDLRIDLFPIGFLILGIIVVFFWRQKQRPSFLICFAIFGVYVIFGLKETFFPLQINGFYADVMRQIPITSQINVIPFNLGTLLTVDDVQRLFIAYIQNIILTVPLGFGINFIAQLKSKSLIWLAITTGLGIEITQLAISLLLGYPYRVVDINDAILNFAGVLIGYGIFRSFAWLYLAMTNRFAIQHTGLPQYIYEVASRTQIAKPTDQNRNSYKTTTSEMGYDGQ